MEEVKNKFRNYIYVQWYPYRFRSGYYIEPITEEALENFYEKVRVSDPNHESFVLIINKQLYYENCNMITIDKYIKRNILSYLFKIERL